MPHPRGLNPQGGLSDDLTKVHAWSLLLCFKSGCSCCIISRPSRVKDVEEGKGEGLSQGNL